MSGFKVIHDSVHGSVKVGDVFLKLLERPELQRLHGVHQLGLAHLVFPGANHTRLEHSLGTFHLAWRMAEALGLDGEEEREVLAAALLHDLGHPPFSHTLETVISQRTGNDHMEDTRAMIMGEKRGYDDLLIRFVGALDPISEMLEAEGIDPRKVGDLIVSDQLDRVGQEKLSVEGDQAHFGEGRYLRQVIHGPVDADQMDYLVRDSHYTGVAHGAIDLDRILQTIGIHHGDLVVHKGGVVSIEGLLVARALMYTSVYFHKTVRIAEMMLCKAVEHSDPDLLGAVHRETDCGLAERLVAAGGVPARIMTLLKYRRLYKKAFHAPTNDLSEEEVNALLPLADYQRRKAKEAEIADRAGVPESEVILDLPSKELMLSEPRIGKTSVPILQDGKVRPLARYSPLARALQHRSIYDWAVMVSTPPGNQEAVARAARKSLF